MLEPLPNMTPLEFATQAQRMAADPSGTRLAAANAGSGKTRVLVDRVSRILLGGTEPSDILCLTYTKAAASEMQERLFETLGNWSVLNDESLRSDLKTLFGQAPETLNPQVLLPKARELFAKALETPEGLKVQTIHAFCERILSRFPIEAGILPGFEPFDEPQMAELRRKVETQILKEAMENTTGEVARALQYLTLERADASLEELFKWMAFNPQKIAAWQTAGLDILAKNLKLGQERDPLKIAEAVWNRMTVTELQSVSAALKTGGANDVKRAVFIDGALAAADAVKALNFLQNIYFTQAGKGRAKIYDAKTHDIAKNWIDTHSLDIMEAVEAIRAGHIFALTESVFHISARYADLYTEVKHHARGLDYSDQILFVRRLLQNSEAADWIRYKLDGGIKHILLDEAQDTSPEQWEIINILSAPFFQPGPDENPNKPRTLFAVGDEKQSIYGFQGARPEQFLTEIRRHSEHATTDIRMTMSFRSTQEVLNVVDAVLFDCGGMQAMFDSETFPPASDEVRHIANREDKGLVELWPVTPPPEKLEENAPWDTTPVDAIGEGHQIEVLSRTIAATIKGWINDGDPIFDREDGCTRPIKPQDVLILVRRRGPLFESIIRQLKRHEIPIAGADRLKLSEATIVKDLIALSRVCLLPSDDLSLAETLKSPLFGFDDNALMKVAIDRPGTLWAAVESRAPETHKALVDFVALSRARTPFDFYARVLDYKDEFGVSMRARFYQRLSLEARDALEAFLHQALEHQSRTAPSLQNFLHAFSQGDVEIKREQDSSLSEVRVMTVHGAKGLESPIVFLPDTTNIPTFRDVLLPSEDGGQVWNKSDAPYVEDLNEAAKTRIEQEQLRLLYVAMTRAESRLIVCGPHVGRSNAKLKPGCWYDWVKRGLEALEASPFDAPPQRHGVENSETGLQYGAPPMPCGSGDVERQLESLELPDWVSINAASEGRRRRVTPSHLLSNPPIEMAVRSPAESSDPNIFKRGNLIHKLLEVLPEIPSSRRQSTAEKMLSGYTDLPGGLRAKITKEVFTVLDHPDFAILFAPGSRAEVSLAGSARGLPDGMYLNAQIDRLCVTDEAVTIVDYKSNRPPPTDPSDVADLYLGQMAAYRELAREIYPGRTVNCALLWTDGPHLMTLPNALLDAALQKVAALPIS
ncbi:MAG: double-strand break repair helicase AddA [Litorimonas sp.]